MDSLLIAHKKENDYQLLENHLVSVAALAKKFANDFNNGDWAEYAGLFHDLGKAFPEWQKYIRNEKGTSINHSEAGAQYTFSKLNEKDCFSKVIPYIISGHHAGLPDYDIGTGNELKKILKEKTYESLFEIKELKNIFNSSFPKSRPFGKNDLSKDSPKEIIEHLHLWIRMLFSCLVDADFLDTEEFMTPQQSKYRGNNTSLSELKKRFDSYMDDKQKHNISSELNSIRTKVLNSCREKAKLAPGFYSLNVPTGGGKTLSSMAFALEHALIHNKKRVIMAIPYTSIIEQTAKVYKFGTDDDEKIEELKKFGKSLFGEENVLEHHCNFQFSTDKELSEKQKLATENWDAPIVVTTNVQLFESLFNAHSSSCRKLHNIVDSVIILDEVQMLPPEYLKSILSVLQGLVKCFGVTVVLCTATQPTLEGPIGSDNATFDGIPKNEVIPIIENPTELAEQLKRVRINTEFVKNKITEWKTLADKLCEFEQVLCIVQTRKDCRELHKLMPDGTIHLSALMCAEERSDVISLIKEKLRKNESVRVISTQLVECGVDVDFPVVFRAIAGMDSVAQSAGRCNREGKLEKGTVYLFETQKNVPSGLLQKGANVTRDLLEKYNYKLDLVPELYNEYFVHYYKSLNNFDKPEFKKNMLDGISTGKFQFRTFSDNYHLVENGFQGTIYVRYCSEKTNKDNLALLQRLEALDIDKKLFRDLVRYSVNLPMNEIQELLEEGRIKQPIEGIYMQDLNDENLYQQGLGLVSDSVQSFNTYVF